MRHSQHETFLKALHGLHKVRIVFFSNKDKADVTRISAPMDFGPKAKEQPPIDRYHFWDFTNPSNPHTESLEATQIRSIFLLNETFEPADFVKWTPKWHIPRDWGRFS